MRVLLDRENTHAGLVQMEAVSVPDLVGSVTQPLVQECVIGLVRCRAHLLGINRFRAFLENIRQGQARLFVHLERDRGLYPQRHPVGRMADILPLGIIGGAVGGFSAQDQEVVSQRGRKAATEAVGLARLVAGRKFQHVDGEIARLQEHGGEHFLSAHLLEGERALPGGPVCMQDSFRPGPGFPERGGLERRLVTALLESSV